MEIHIEQHIGNEFVRRYYTALHDAPGTLHTFYSDTSCYLHKGVEQQPPVKGLAEIHKIMDMKFQNCITKIREVDTLPTLENGIQVFVTGQLSNNSKPMRPFTQHFMLEPQSSKKYTVQNSIFFYHDELFPKVQQHSATQENTQVLQQEATVKEPEETAVQHQQSETTVCDSPQEHPEISSASGVHLIEEKVNSPDEMSPAKPQHVATGNEPSPAAPVDPKQKEEPEPKPKIEVPKVPHEQESAKPASWAAIVSEKLKQGGDIPAFSAPIKSPKYAAPKPWAKPQTKSAPKLRHGEPPSDAHQLFVGGLPQNTQESELRELFEGFGKVAEVRINRKSSTKRNFAFVVFKSIETVKKILAMNDIMLRGNIHLSVQEKKQRVEQGNQPAPGTRMGPHRGGQDKRSPGGSDTEWQTVGRSRHGGH